MMYWGDKECGQRGYNQGTSSRNTEKYSEVCACVCAGVMHYTCLVLMVCFIFFFFFLIFNCAVNEIDTMTQYTPVKLKEKTLNP